MGKVMPNDQNEETFEQFMASLKEIREINREISLSMMDTEQKMKETDRRMKETDRKLGELGNRFGELAEHLVGPSIMEKFNDLGFNFTQRARDLEIKNPDKPNNLTEIDILLENGDIVIAIEVKAKPKEKDIFEHIERMEVLRMAANRRGDKRKFRGAIAGAIMNESICEKILQNSFYLIEQSGDTVKLTIPEGFVPREW